MFHNICVNFPLVELLTFFDIMHNVAINTDASLYTISLVFEGRIPENGIARLNKII